jgi:endo-1,4-beta-xylanase
LNRRNFFSSVAGIAGWALASRPALAQAVEQPLKLAGQSCGIKVGAQVEIKPLQQNAQFAELVHLNFNMITPGNEFKWTRLRPKPDTFYFDDADWMMRFAQDNGLAVHGHNLCWNAFNPPWFDSVINKSNARQFLTQHITTVMKRYAGRIDSWDVVNEPVVPWDSRSDGLYPGIWVNTLGPEYIDIAFQTAEEAVPKALRVMNLNHVEYETPDCAKTQQRAISLLKQYLARKVPIQAIGLESHMDASQPLGDSSLVRFIQQVRDMGLEVLITELDVNDTHVDGDVTKRDGEVARCYHDYLSRIAQSSDTKRVIFWTPSDQWVWMNSVKGEAFQRSDRQPHRAGLWDENMRPKPALNAVATALKQVCTFRSGAGKA